MNLQGSKYLRYKRWVLDFCYLLDNKNQLHMSNPIYFQTSSLRLGSSNLRDIKYIKAKRLVLYLLHKFLVDMVLGMQYLEHKKKL